MKMLYILNVANRVNNFCMSSLIAAKRMNIEYHIAGNWGYATDSEREADEKKYGVRIYQVDFKRSPFSPQNVKAYKQLQEIVAREQFDAIHCNTPIGGLLGRLVGKKYKTKHVIYQAHGFHFYKGAPMLNWLLYYPIEKWLAHYTDTLITINSEDCALANKKLRLRNNGQKYYVPGVGIEPATYYQSGTDRSEVRRTLGVRDDELLLIAVGRLDVNKNNETIIRALAKTQRLKLIVCGDCEQMDRLKCLSSQLGVADRVQLLGNRDDVIDLYHASDIFIMMSFREGLSRSIMEAMAVGLPCLVSDIRGNRDLIIQNENGLLCNVTDTERLAVGMMELAENPGLRTHMAHVNTKRVKDYAIDTVIERLIRIYKTI